MEKCLGCGTRDAKVHEDKVALRMGKSATGAASETIFVGYVVWRNPKEESPLGTGLARQLATH